MNKCRNCLCWVSGTCHAHAPSTVWTGSTMFTAWPVTRPDEGCVLDWRSDLKEELPDELASPQRKRR